MTEQSDRPDNDAERRITEFLDAVDGALDGAGIPPAERFNVIGDLRGQIHDMLADYTEGPTTPSDVEAVLARIDPPEAYADHAPAVSDRARRPAPKTDLADVFRKVFSRLRPGGGPLFARYTARAREVLALAETEARCFSHEYIGTEHLLIGLVHEQSGLGGSILREAGLDLATIEQEVRSLVRCGPEPVADGPMPHTPRMKRCIELAIRAARDLHHSHVGTEHLLLGMLEEREGVAAQILTGKFGLTPEAVRQRIAEPQTRSTMPAERVVAPRPERAPVALWPPDSAKTVSIGGIVYAFVATAEDTGGVYSLLRLSIGPEGAISAQTDGQRDRAFYVLQGGLVLQVGDRSVPADAGTFINIPKGTRHALTNPGPGPAEALLIATPAGLERSLDDDVP